LLQKQSQHQVAEIGKNAGATIRFPETSSQLDAVAITAAPARIKEVAIGLLNLVPMTFTVGPTDDPKFAEIIESSDFHYSVTDQFKVIHRTELTVKETPADKTTNSPKTVAVQFQYMRPNFNKFQDALKMFYHYIRSKGASIEEQVPSELPQLKTKPFDAEKSASYGQASTVQPYHTPAQIAAAAQGLHHPSYHSGNQHVNYHHGGAGGPNGMYPPMPAMHGHQNGFTGHHNGHHNNRGFQNVPQGNFAPGGRGGGMYGNRQMHNPHPQNQFGGGYPQSFQGNGGRGGIPSQVPNHVNHFSGYNGQYGQGGGMNPNGAPGFQRHPRQYISNPPNGPTGETHPPPPPGMSMNYPQQMYRNSNLGSPSPLDGMNSLGNDLPDTPGTTGGNGNYRSHHDAHTPGANSGPFSPSSQSYFPPQANHMSHNGFPPHGQGYPPSTHNSARFQHQ